MTKIVCISDTHTLHDKIELPPGDILIHSGDFTGRGTIPEISEFNYWLGNLPHKYKYIWVCAGNHELGLEYEPNLTKPLLTNCTYLQDESIVAFGKKFYFSPWQPEFLNWAFNLQRGAELKEKWDKIPLDTEILVTHGPPFGILDKMERETQNLGDEELLKAVRRIKPKYNIFGHIHAGYGKLVSGDTTFVNASICNEAYVPLNKPIVLEI